MFDFLRRQPRLLASAGLGIVVGLLLPAAWPLSLRMIAGWDVAAGLYLALAWLMMMRADTAHIRAHARGDDESRWVILLMCAGAATTSLGAIVSLLGDFKDLPAADRAPHLALGVFTILVSWFFLHTVFTVHYAHEFYGNTSEGGGKPAARGGFAFPGNAKAWSYLDFAYYSFTIGMTAQTSDIAVTTTGMRRLTLAHAILTFFFNTVILAFSVNIAASLL
ncbi:MAG TPA: DUF1345 domain-containing protein [Aliidongia sp.]|uniref:DUF1345 domain-containing protein n=1 Tax=Aliidongia sp. TaxID=1914230 RepID=UPI002DDCE3C7|nr:DUF1345 domain-containing protein [Aliidongia sp.]HEV2673469.1 DUF1345 domain-containing protein [Aliidongia sp.]